MFSSYVVEMDIFFQNRLLWYWPLIPDQKRKRDHKSTSFKQQFYQISVELMQGFCKYDTRKTKKSQLMTSVTLTFNLLLPKSKGVIYKLHATISTKLKSNQCSFSPVLTKMGKKMALWAYSSCHKINREHLQVIRNIHYK